MPPIDWGVLLQQLGWAGTAVVGLVYIFIKYLWPFYVKRVEKADADKAAREKRLDEERAADKALQEKIRQDYIASRAASDAAADARDAKLIGAFGEVTSFLEKRDAELKATLTERNASLVAVQSTLVSVLDKLSSKLGGPSQ